MLYLSRLDAGKLLPFIQAANGAEIVSEAVRSIEPAAVQKNIAVEVGGSCGTMPCRTDPIRVRQILTNLLQNAVRFSPEGEKVTVSIRPEGEMMLIEVTDRGKGIPKDKQEEIFKAFDLDWDRLERGTGLGLDVSRRLARLLGGDLTVDSELGHGARFTLQLPCKIGES
jgi:signal transduction histidine kinase